MTVYCEDLPGGQNFSVVYKNSQAQIQPNTAQYFPRESIPAVGLWPCSFMGS